MGTFDKVILVEKDKSTYFMDTTNHNQDLDEDSDTYNGYEDAEDMDTATTIMLTNSYDLAYNEYNETSEMSP
jgi:hypothetical protein